MRPTRFELVTFGFGGQRSNPTELRARLTQNVIKRGAQMGGIPGWIESFSGNRVYYLHDGRHVSGNFGCATRSLADERQCE